MKRERSLSSEHELELWARRSRRRQLRIEIPRAILSHSQCSTKSSSTLKESPSSLFSAASVDSIFDDIPPSPGLMIDAIPTTHCAPMTATSSAGSLSATAISCTNNPHDSNELQKPRPGPALLIAPPIQGLYFDPSLRLPQELANKVVAFCMSTYFQSPNLNQVMLFGRANNLNSDNVTQYPDTNTSTGNSCTIPHDDSSCSAASTLPSPVLSLTETCNTSNTTGLPTIFVTLLSTLSILLKPLLPPKTYSLLFPFTTTQARQAIINLYAPGEGISPHVDLIKRFGDGIIGVSFGSGCVMRFDRQTRSSPPLSETMEKHTNRWELYLPERSVYVLTEDARYGWTHGIEKATRDYAVVDAKQEKCIWIDRSVRLSVTYRWLLPGADIVGPSEDD